MLGWGVKNNRLRDTVCGSRDPLHYCVARGRACAGDGGASGTLLQRLLPWLQRHDALPNKSQTYTVEGVNADLRHYLARLRRRSRCFSRSLKARRAAVRLFVYAYNRRQLHRWYFPNYAPPLRDFI